LDSSEDNTQAPEEIVLTGDDLVVEYVGRLADALRDRLEIP
jgi:hypothetical protein